MPFLLPKTDLSSSLTPAVPDKFPWFRRLLPGRRLEDLTDTDLVDLARGFARGGGFEVVEELVRRHRRRIYNLALRMVGPDQAADVQQETFLELVRNLGSFRGEAAVGSWLYRVASNRCLDLLRARRRRPVQSLEALEEESPAASARWAVGPPDAARLEEREAIKEAIAKLPPIQKAVLILRDVQGLSYEEIAQALDVPVGTVRSRLSRARGTVAQKLRPLMETDETEAREMEPEDGGGVK